MYNGKLRTLDLEDKPSGFLNQGLMDLQKAANMKNVKIDMNTWCLSDGNKCTVCMAGSMILCRDDPKFTSIIAEGLEVQPSRYIPEVANKLYAVSGFCLGKIVDTLTEYKLADTDKIQEYEDLYGKRNNFPKYRENKYAFYLGLHQLVKDLNSVGL